MLNHDDIASQREFVTHVVTLNPHAKPQVRNLDTRFAARLNVYSQSFVGRTISALTEAVLSPACNLFGESCVKEVVARFVDAHPPNASSLEHALAGLPQFISEHADDVIALQLASLIEACLTRWTLLIGPDRTSDKLLIAGTLTGPSAIVKAKDNVDLWNVLEIADCQDQTAPPSTHSLAVDILLVKMSMDTIVSVPVPRPLLPLATSMAAHLPVTSALNALSEGQLSRISPQSLQEFLQFLKIRDMLVR